jgi:hypothetical protein
MKSNILERHAMAYAIITMGQIASAASGSMGGLTYSHNKGGAYVRSRAIPTNPNTPRQVAVRATFGTLTKSWAGLGPDGQLAWNLFAAANPIINALGASVTTSGLAAYTGLNAALLGAGEPLITSPPVDRTVLPLGPVSGATFTTTLGVLTLAEFAVTAPTGNDSSYYVYATPPMSPGINPNSSIYRFLGAEAEPAMAGNVGLVTSYTDTFSNLVTPGAAIWLNILLMNNASGATMPLMKFQTIVTGT